LRSFLSQPAPRLVQARLVRPSGSRHKSPRPCRWAALLQDASGRRRAPKRHSLFRDHTICNGGPSVRLSWRRTPFSAMAGAPRLRHPNKRPCGAGHLHRRSLRTIVQKTVFPQLQRERYTHYSARFPQSAVAVRLGALWFVQCRKEGAGPRLAIAVLPRWIVSPNRITVDLDCNQTADAQSGCLAPCRANASTSSEPWSSPFSHFIRRAKGSTSTCVTRVKLWQTRRAKTPTASSPASLQPDQNARSGPGQPASSCSKTDASNYFPKWD
jgi:hypothetical protein